VQNNPTSTAKIGLQGWTNPTYAYTSNDQWATASPPESTFRQQKWYNYHFDDSIPYGSTIDQIIVKVEGYGNDWANEDWKFYVWNGSQLFYHSLPYPYEGDTVIEVDVTLDCDWTRQMLLDETFYTKMWYNFESGGGGCPTTQICPELTTTLTNYWFAEDSFRRYVEKYGFLTQTNYIRNDMMLWIRRKNMYSYPLFIGDLLSDNPEQWHPMDRKMIEYVTGTRVFIAETGLGGKALYLQNQGCDVFGVTLSSVTSQIAHNRGLINVVNGTVLKRLNVIPKKAFDTIIIGDNLLQKRYPTQMQEVLSIASALLKDNGRMIVSGYFPDDSPEGMQDYIEQYGNATTIYRHEYNGTHDDWVEVNNLYPDDLVVMFETAGLNVIDAILPYNPVRKVGYYYIIGEKSPVTPFGWDISPIHNESKNEQGTVYLDWIPVNVTYTTHPTQIYVESNGQAGANSDLTLTDSSNALYDPDDNVAYCSGQWYGENWYFVMFNATDCSGTINYVNVTFYSIYANTNPNSDTFAIMGNKEDSAPTSGTWDTIWSGTSLWTTPQNKTYNITDSCGIDTFDEINQTRFKITSTAKSGGEDTVTWYVDAINITVSLLIGNYTVTHYFYSGGTLLVNGSNTNNGTSDSYSPNTVLNITAVTNYQYTFKNHTYDSSSTTDNPFYLTVTQDYTTYTYFRFLFDCNYIGLNNTIAGDLTQLRSDWTDLNTAEGLSHFLFSTNNTGSWTNGTWSSSWVDTTWAEETITINTTVELIISFRFYVNDTNGDEYASTICFFQNSIAGISDGELINGLIYGVGGGILLGMLLIVRRRRKERWI